MRYNSGAGAGGRCENSGDVVAAALLLRACVGSLLDCLPSGGCEGHELCEMVIVEAGEEGRRGRLGMWKRMLEGFLVGKPGGFEVMGYADLVLENLRNPRDGGE